MNLARAVQVSMDTAVQPCEDWKVIFWFSGTLGGFVGFFMGG